jgi:methionyl-tRNA formyltransferase
MKVCPVAGIIHPLEPRPRATLRIRRLIRQAKSHGWAAVALHVLGKTTARTKAHKRGGQMRPVDFSAGVVAYDRIPSSLIHTDCDVRQSGSADLLRSLQPDLSLFLGGPVYPKAFIEAAPLSLNFHSGISPIYNGTASIKFAFANGHPHLCGGTLMVMGAEIDGGGILGHYLTAVQSGDSPDSLFDKTVRGAAPMYARLLEHLQAGNRPMQQIPQAAPLFYTRDFDFDWHHSQMIAKNLRNDLPARHEREETMVEYWREPTEEAAHNLYRATLDRLLWESARPKGK